MKRLSIHALLIFLLFLNACLFTHARITLGRERESQVRPMTTETFSSIELGMHTAPITKLATDSSKKYLLTASLDKSVKAWNLETGQFVKNFLVPSGEQEEGCLYAMAVTPNGRQIACGGWTGLSWENKACVYILDLEAGILVNRLADMPNAITSLVYSRNGNYLVVGMGGKNGIRVYRTMDYALVGVDRHYNAPVHGMDFDRYGNLGTVCYDGYLRLYDKKFALRTTQALKHGVKPYSISFSPDGSHLAIGFMDTVTPNSGKNTGIEVLSTRDFSKRLLLPSEPNGDLRAVCWSRDYIYAGGSYSTDRNEPMEEEYRVKIRRWDPKKKFAPLPDIAVSDQNVQDILPLPDGRVAFATADPCFGIFHPDGSVQYREDPRHIPWGADLLTHQKEFQISEDGHIVRFPYRRPRSSGYFYLTPVHVTGQGIFVSGPNGEERPYLYPAYKTSVFSVDLARDPSSLTVCGKKVSLGRQKVICFAVSPEEDKVVLGTNRSLLTLDKHGARTSSIDVPSAVCMVNVTRNGKGIVAGLADGTVRWYQMENGQELLAFFPHVDQKKWVAWTKDASGLYYACAEDADDFLKEYTSKENDVAPDLFTIQMAQKNPGKIVEALSVLRNRESQSLAPDFIPPPFFMPPPSRKEQIVSRKPKLYLLSIGVNDYRKEIGELRFAVKDAVDFVNIMKRQANGFYEEVIVRSLLNEQATKKMVYEALDWIKTHTTKQDMAILFIAGHGTNDDDGYYHFLPHDCRIEHLTTTAVPFSAIQKTASSLSGKTVFLIDTCRSGRVMGKKRIDIRRSLSELAQSNKSIVVISSSSDNQVAEENEHLQNGVFTKFLIEGISGKASGEGREITIINLYKYVSQKIKEHRFSQTPTIAIPTSISDFPIAWGE